MQEIHSKGTVQKKTLVVITFYVNNKQFTYVFAKFYNGCFALPMSTEPIDTGKGT